MQKRCEKDLKEAFGSKIFSWWNTSWRLEKKSSVFSYVNLNHITENSENFHKKHNTRNLLILVFVLFLYSRKKSENLRFPDVFREYRLGIINSWYGLTGTLFSSNYLQVVYLLLTTFNFTKRRVHYRGFTGNSPRGSEQIFFSCLWMAGSTIWTISK